MFHRPDKKTTSAHAKSLADLTEIVTSEELLYCPKRQDLLQKLSESNLLEAERYQSVGLKLIHNLISYCQSLPETENSYYAHPAGLFDHALNRTEAAMSLLRQHMKLQDNKAATEEQALWSYALFSASLLKDIGKLQTDFCVDLYDANGQLLTRWTPLLESMLSVGRYYHYQFQINQDEAFRHRLNMLFTKLLMPNSGFVWIASNIRVLKVWLALLDDGEESGSGTLKAILSRADDIAVQRELNALQLKMQKISGGARSNRIGTFVDIPLEPNQAKENVGIKFIRWVQKELALGNLIVNKGPLSVVQGGMVMSEIMYKLFVKDHPEYKKWQVIRHGFMSLGMYKISRDGAVVLRNDIDSKENMDNVLLERNSILLPDEVKIADLSTGKIRKVTAVEVVHTMYADMMGQDLNPLLSSESGHWQSPTKASKPLFSPTGTIHSG